MTRRVRPLAFLAAAFVSASCAGPSDPNTSLGLATPVHFEFVSGVLGAHCGSLDCHGQVGRSLRVYSRAGLRLDSSAFPNVDAGVVSDAEVDANYRSAVALEPELMALVVHEQGRNPERLTLIRKARGSEHHKGGAAIGAGSAADRCLLSWLSSEIDEAACDAGALIVRPVAGAP